MAFRVWQRLDPSFNLATVCLRGPVRAAVANHRIGVHALPDQISAPGLRPIQQIHSLLPHAGAPRRRANR